VWGWDSTLWGSVGVAAALGGCQQACGTYTGDVHWQTNVPTKLIIYLK